MIELFNKIKESGKSRIVLIIIGLLILTGVRLYYGHDLTLSGDEIAIGVVQAAGKWDYMKETFPFNRVVEMDLYRQYYTFSPEYNGYDVLSIMWKDKLHPPLYFIILHYIIALFGSGIFALRTFSVLISTASVVVAYLLGRDLVNRKTGFLAAVFLSLSPYGLEYSVMVRLYPLAMFLALLSTYFLVLLLKSRSISFRNPLLYLYMFVSLAGLYTYYSFSVILLSHFIFAVLGSGKSIKSVLTTIAAYGIVLILFIPWILPFFDGMDQVNTRDFYFKGSYPAFFIIKYLFRIVFFPYDRSMDWFGSSAISWIILLLSLGLIALITTGFSFSKENRLFKYLSLSVIVYISISVINDIVFETSTFIFDRQHYYTVPVILLIVAGCLAFLPGISLYRILAATTLVLLLATGFSYRFLHKSMFDGPYYFNELNASLDQQTNGIKDSECLIMFNLRDKRYTLPFIYHSTHNYDILLLTEGFNSTLLDGKSQLQKYQSVCIINIDLNERKRKRLSLKPVDIDETSRYLSEHGFYMNGPPFIFNNEEKLTMYGFNRTGAGL